MDERTGRGLGPAPVEGDDGHSAPGQQSVGLPAAGSAPGGNELPRRFRPDVEGLRAVAILLVVLYHAGVPGLPGGFVGVDVFFVISGFLITGLLVSERERTGGVSIVGFYARRARRILPAATLLIIATVLASYHWLGFLMGNSVADDGRWAAVFLANLHFALTGTQYFAAQAPPSPLQHMWSLGVEEQFYLVWPALVILVGLVARRFPLRVRLGAVLAAITAASLAWSILQTSTNGTWAYFSPLTRAWELAAGGLVAVAAPGISRLPARLAFATGIGGLTAIVVSALVLNRSTPYPGFAAALPVSGAVLTIAAGTACAGSGAEVLLRLPPLQWLGKRSYSWYLWHWPFLVIPAEYSRTSLLVWQNILWALAALAVAAATYRFVENPVRRSRMLGRHRVASVVGALLLIATTVGFATWQIETHQGGRGADRPLPVSHLHRPPTLPAGGRYTLPANST